MDVFALSPVTMLVESSTESSQGVAFTGYVPACGVTRVKLAIIVRDPLDDAIEVQPAIQYAASDPDAPGSWSGVGSTWYGTETGGCTGEITVTPGSNFYLRFGVLVRNKTGYGGTWKRAEVTLYASGRD